MTTITVAEWAIIRSFVMAGRANAEADLEENGSDADPAIVAKVNADLDACHEIVKRIDAGAVDLVLGRATP